MKTALTLALLLAVPAAAQQTTEVSLRQVSDRRAKEFFSELTLTLELPKIQSKEVVASRAFVKSATDDTGSDLVDPEESNPEFEGNPRAMSADGPPAPALVSVKLLNPPRKAKTIAAVSGEIELFMPGRDPNSIAEIAKFTTMGGKALAHKALKANGVEITMLTTEQIEAERNARIEKKKKEYAEAGYEGENLEDAVRSAAEYILPVEEGELLARIRDPQQRLREITWVDAAGEVSTVIARDDEGLVTLSSWGGAPQSDWTMRVSMKTEKNVVRYAFALKDVPLP